MPKAKKTITKKSKKEVQLRKYEIMVIIKSESPLSKEKAFSKQFSEVIQPFDGKIEKEEYWGERRFSYIMDKMEKGVYTVINFTLAPEHLMAVEGKLKLMGGIVRYLITQIANVKTQMSNVEAISKI